MLRIRELRTEKNASQQKIAAALGVSRQVFANWENEINQPDLKALGELADFFGVSTDYLLGRSDELGYVTVQNFPAPPALSNEETELLARFREMDRAQKMRVMAYCEGMGDANRSKYKA